jgi:hypothetical protein
MSIEAAFPMIVRCTPLGVWVRHDESSGEVLYVRPDEAHRYRPAPEACLHCGSEKTSLTLTCFNRDCGKP